MLQFLSSTSANNNIIRHFISSYWYQLKDLKEAWTSRSHLVLILSVVEMEKLDIFYLVVEMDINFFFLRKIWSFTYHRPLSFFISLLMVSESLFPTPSIRITLSLSRILHFFYINDNYVLLCLCDFDIIYLALFSFYDFFMHVCMCNTLFHSLYSFMLF